MEEPKKPEKLSPGEPVSVRLGPLAAECDEIVDFLRTDHESQRFRSNPGRATAIRYALGIAVKHVRQLRRERSEAAGG